MAGCSLWVVVGSNMGFEKIKSGRITASGTG